MPNAKVSRLLRKYSTRTGRNYDQMKTWYEDLTWPLRAEANKVMRAELAPKQEAPQP